MNTTNPKVSFDAPTLSVTSVRTVAQRDPAGTQAPGLHAPLLQAPRVQAARVTAEPVAAQTLLHGGYPDGIPPDPPHTKIPAKARIPNASGFPVGGSPRRNGRTLAIGTSTLLAFLLGLSTALLMPYGDSALRQAALPVTGEPDADQADGDTATRALTPDLTDVGAAIDPQVSSAPVANDLSVAVLAGLRSVPHTAAGTRDATQAAHAALGAIKLRMLREAVLARLYDVERIEQNGVMRVRLRMVDTAVFRPDSDSDLTALLERARPEIALSLRTPEGATDLDTMMFSMVQNALLEDGAPETTAAAREMSRRVFAASTARTQDVGGQRIYTVQAGDSLAYIALQFFGMPDAFRQILDANPDTLQSPEEIQLGQRLIIPS